jgi:hypothetical protein
MPCTPIDAYYNDYVEDDRVSEKFTVEVHPLDSDRWEDLVQLFGTTGGDGGCWCMYWRLRQKDYQAGDHHRNRRLLKTLVEDGIPTRARAYSNDRQLDGVVQDLEKLSNDWNIPVI